MLQGLITIQACLYVYDTLLVFKGLSSQQSQSQSPTQCLLRLSQPMKIAKGKTTKLASLKDQGWQVKKLFLAGGHVILQRRYRLSLTSTELHLRGRKLRLVCSFSPSLSPYPTPPSPERVHSPLTEGQKQKLFPPPSLPPYPPNSVHPPSTMCIPPPPP